MKLYFSKTHEWVKVTGENKAEIGLTDHAQHELGDIVYAGLPAVGMSVEEEGVLCEVESVKAVTEVFSPIAGTVLSVNTVLDEEPGLLNSNPMGTPICEMEFSALPVLLTEAEYNAFIKG